MIQCTWYILTLILGISINKLSIWKYVTLECHKSYIIFYIPSISIEIASITINIPSISNQNLVYQLNNMYKSWLSMEVNCQTRSMYVFLVWYSQNIIWCTWYIISNVTFTFWKTWYNNYKFVMPGISHEKLGLKFFFCWLTISMLIHRNSSILQGHICTVQSSFVLELSRFSRFAIDLANRLTKR